MKMRWPKWKARQHGARILGFFLLVFFLLQTLAYVEFDFFDRLENIAYDARIRLTMPKKPFSGIVIVDIDEKSLAEEGRWPWGRDRVASMLDKLFNQYQIAAAGFDIVFAEPDENSGLKLLDKIEQSKSELGNLRPALEKFRPGLEHDKRLAASLAGKPVVLGYYFNLESGNNRVSGALPPPLFPAEFFKGVETDFSEAQGFGANLPELQQAAFSGGHFNPQPDSDGVVRRVQMLIKYKGGYYESLVLGLARAVLGPDSITPVVRKDNAGYSALERLEVGGLKVPLDANGNSLVPYRGEEKTFRYISAADVLHGRANPKDLAGKIVLIGTSAPGLLDLRSTPVGVAYPGVEVHANMLAGILTQTIKQSPPYIDAVDVTTLLLVGIFLIVLLPKLSPLKGMLLTLFTVALILGGNLAAWKYGNLVIPLAAPLLLALSLFVLDTVFGYFFETRNKRLISERFGQYVPPKLVDEMSKNPEMFAMKSESREMTVLFSDIRDFTSISEGLDPESLSSMINEYLTAMSEVIYKHNGTIDKYIGDAIMAFWGAPVSSQTHAQDAVLAAMEMHEVLEQLNAKFPSRGWPALKIGIGINSGLMNVGNMGSSFRLAYTVMGDAVNCASRLEGLTKYYGVGVLVSEDSKKDTAGVVLREVDRVMVKGKAEALTIYQPLGFSGKIDESVQEEAKMFDEALKLYRAKDWQGCRDILDDLQEKNPKTLLYRLYQERISAYLENPPPADWNGVCAYQTK